MSGKREKSLKSGFLKITKFCNISENHPNKSKALSQNVKMCPNWLKMRPTDRVVFSKTKKKDLHVHFLTKKMGNYTNGSGHFLPPPIVFKI